VSKANDERARAQRDQRVDIVLDRMTAGEWQGTRTARELAASWECSLGAVQDYAREASGIIRKVIEGDAADLRAQLLTGLADLKRRALEACDLKAALGAFELEAKVLGLITQKVSHKVDAGAPKSTAEAKAELRSMLAALDEAPN
jgi:hypothetical protein